MVRFKTVKPKHCRRARNLTETEYLGYAIKLVAEWDFVNEETGDAIPISPQSVKEMSSTQIEELSTSFDVTFGEGESEAKTEEK